MRLTVLAASLTLFTGVIHAKSEAMSDQRVGIVTIAAFTASGDLPRLKTAFNEALDAGLTINEIKEVLVQMYAYAGFPRSLNGINAFNEVVKQRVQQGRKDAIGAEPGPLPANKSSLELGGEIRTQLTGSTAVAEYATFVPVIDEFLRAHLFGDIFGRDNLDFRNREIATIAALATLNGLEPQLKAHFNVGLNVGLTSDQLKGIVEVIEARVDREQARKAAAVLDEALRNRPASPSAVAASAISTSRSARGQSPNTELKILRAGSDSPQEASATNFTGKVSVESPFRWEAPSRIGGATVTFQAGARTAWHSHPLGQSLIVISGTGWVQREGGPKQEIRAGDIVWTPPGVKHWHGATLHTPMTHVAIAEALDGAQVAWMEPVSESEYRR